ncbi:MAG: nucleoside monophosphate kinase [Candidatus Methylacidiphilales bacterium]|nr:nucleoside monophosphate kinase [Candidatus Methylacidiphilales bacterium]
MKARAIVLIGPPASGKGTFGKVLGLLPGFLHFSMGHAFRTRVSRDQAERDLMQDMFQKTSRGLLVPDAIALRLFDDCMKSLLAGGTYQPDQQILVLDGVPRTPAQARVVAEQMDVLVTFEFLCTDEEIFHRIRGRAVKEGRADDASEEIVRTRLQVYRAALPGMREVFGDKITTLDTNRPAHRVLQELLEHIP